MDSFMKIPYTEVMSSMIKLLLWLWQVLLLLIAVH